MIAIKVVREISDLVINEWQFRLIDFDFILQSFDVYERATKRHKKHILTNHYFSSSSGCSNMKEEDVPLPEDVKAEAMQQLLSKINIGKKSEFYGR